MTWCIEKPADAAALRRLSSEIRESFPGLDANRDPEWWATEKGWPEREFVFLVDRADEKVRGHALLSVTRTTLDYAFGPIVLRRVPVRQVNLFQNVAVGSSAERKMVSSCLDAIAEIVPRNGVFHLGAVPVESELYRQLVDPSGAAGRRFYVLPWGDETLLCRIRWDGDFDAYLGSLSKVSRKELRRNMRALFEDPSIRAEVRSFRSPKDVDVFLRDAVPVSDKTYQKRLLELGLSYGDSVERSIRLAADRGGFLGCILYIDDVPVAFEYGFVWGGVCVMKQAGYDPAWAHRQVGSVLFASFIRKLGELGIRVSSFDLMPGLNLFKLRTANERAVIQHFHLFPRTTLGAVRYYSLAVLHRTAAVARRLLGRKSDKDACYRKSDGRRSLAVRHGLSAKAALVLMECLCVFDFAAVGLVYVA